MQCAPDKNCLTGLPAALGLLCGVYEASIEANEWITYPCVDGVSAGALIASFLAHTNCLNPHEVVNEVCVRHPVYINSNATRNR
jgi:hypothetical protein